MEESHKTHRPHIKVGKDEEKKKKVTRCQHGNLGNYQSQAGVHVSDFWLKRPSKTWNLFAVSVIAGADK